eukprot:scaffold44717_cov22-Tisochrysis_lutea.AAC.1
MLLHPINLAIHPLCGMRFYILRQQWPQQQTTASATMNKCGKAARTHTINTMTGTLQRLKDAVSMKPAYYA